MTIIRRSCLALAVATALITSAAAQTTPELSKEAKALQGAWDVTEFNGQAPPVSIALQFDGAKYSVTINGTIDESGTYALDATKTPWTFDLNIKEGTDGGKLQLGLLEMKDNAIHGVLGTPGATPRPASFNSADAALVFVAVKRK